MNTDKILRKHLLTLLTGGQAYASFSEIVKDFPENKMNKVFPKGSYTPWHLLEHIRITQWDILDFIINPEYTEITWPDDYWSPKKRRAKKADWERTIKEFEKDYLELEKKIRDPKTDLYAKIPHGTGQTILREILLVVDHNSYHLGEFSIMRQVMESWGKGHEN